MASKGCVTWPGDDRPPGKFPREVLQEDHTHFVLLDTDDPDAASAYRFKLTSALLSCARGPLNAVYSPTQWRIRGGGLDMAGSPLSVRRLR